MSKYLVTWEDTELDTFDYDKQSGWGPGSISHKVTKKKLYNNRIEADKEYSQQKEWSNKPKLYKCEEIQND